jgi:ABC-2 type transport system ATP-binding protein
VLIINEGRIAAQGSPEEIGRTMKGEISWDLVLKGKSAAETGELLKELGHNVRWEELFDRDDRTVFLSFPVREGNIGGEDIFDWAVASGLKILSMNQKRLSLEDIFVKLTREASDGEET